MSHNTARAWLSVLANSYLIHRLPAWHPIIRKQVVKAPKLPFFDSGLACCLLGIREPEHLRLHPWREAIFESWVTAEVYKASTHSGFRPNLSHYRKTRGTEAHRSLPATNAPENIAKVCPNCLLSWSSEWPRPVNTPGNHSRIARLIRNARRWKRSVHHHNQPSASLSCISTA